MAKDLVKTFTRLCNYLQDPCHVARFQNLCGVKAAFPYKPTETDRGLLVNGAYGGARETVERVYLAQKTSGRELDGEDSGVSANGAAAAAAATQQPEDGDGVGVVTRGNESRDGVGLTRRAVNVASTDRSKPLRRNSLTDDVGQEFIIQNKFLFYLFTFGTELGNEMFFIIFFPFLFWNVDALVGRRLIVVWAWNLFFGQSTKDLVRWSRPASPPVVKVEVFYNSEYSMPSTHAMTGTAIPFCVFFLSYGRWQYPFILGLCVAVSWSILVCVSRVYMGMHSILEVITGSLYTLLILAVLLPSLERIDDFYKSGAHAPLAIVAAHVGLGLVAFSLDSWSTSRGDTAQGLGTAAGAALATHINHQLGLCADLPPSALPLALPPLDASLLLSPLLRFAVGVGALLLTRAAMKAAAIPLLCRACGLPPGDARRARQHARVELPYRYVVYGVVGFTCVCLVPLLFGFLNLA